MAKDYEPRVHTAEHILNQTMMRMFGCGRCFSSHLNPGKSKCDFHFGRIFSAKDGRLLEEHVNAVLAADLPVTELLLPPREAAKATDISRLPAGAAAHAQGRIRLVAIGDYDICPCIGAHVSSTGRVGGFCLLSHSYAPGASPDLPGVLRLRFRAGKEPRSR